MRATRIDRPTPHPAGRAIRAGERYLLFLVVSALALAWLGELRAEPPPPTGRPEAVIDLSTVAGVQQVKGPWRYSDTKIIEVDFRGPGPDGQPTGGPIKTYDYTSHAGGADFDDALWEVIDPTMLARRRSTGRLCFNWYRIRLTVPERVGDFDPTGSTVVFETSLDDYAEVWVDGELSRAPGRQSGGINVLAPDGTHRGRIETGAATTNGLAPSSPPRDGVA